MRRDLSHSQQCVQSAHACIEAANEFKFDSLPEHPHLILLGIKSESQIEKTKNKLVEQGIPFVEFREPDKNNEITALCTDSVYGEKRDFFKKFQLLR